MGGSSVEFSERNSLTGLISSTKHSAKKHKKL